MKHPVTRTSKKVLKFAHKLLAKTSKVLFGTTSHVTKKTGKGAAKLLGKVGKLTKPVRLDNGAIQYTLKGVGKGVVIITNAGAGLVNSAGHVVGTVLKGTKDLGVVLLDTTGKVISKASRGYVKLGGRKSRRRRRRKSRKRRKSRRKRKKSKRRRRRSRRRRR
jgi:hypothetical protein